MCGIAAVVGPIDVGRVARAVRAMIDAQAHRGPDDEGLSAFAAGEIAVGLGNRRLAIQDVSPLGHQPMTHPGTNDVLVYNGVIYNSPDLRRTLQAAGHALRGRSDTEVLLHAYEEWGTDCLGRLAGMFAFALWDARRRVLFVARDPLGIKPLYWTGLAGGGFACASELRALCAGGLVGSDIDARALAGYLGYGAVQEPSTILRGVRSFPPGSFAEIDPAHDPVMNVYWRPPQPDGEVGRLEERVEEGRTILREAVRRHLLSDVPVGIFTSSGLDSTAVLGLASRVSEAPVNAFTVTFPEDGSFDEGPLAREAVRGLRVAHHECPVSARTALAWAEDGLARMDQPSMDGLNTYVVSRAVRERGLVVALSGQGGDEVFGGYGTFRDVPRWQRWLRPFGVLGAAGRAAFARVLTLALSGPARKKARDLARVGSDLVQLYFRARRVLSDEDLDRCGVDRWALGLTDSLHLPEANPAQHLVEGDAVATVGHLETRFYLLNMLLRDGDVFGMAASLEIRVPLLDRDVVEWAFRLPGEALLPPGAPNKFLLRRICAEFYGPAQSRQKKRGFTLPLRSWMLGPLRELMEESLRTVARSGLVRPEGVESLRAAFLREPESSAWSRVWLLVALGRWLDARAARPAREAA